MQWSMSVQIFYRTFPLSHMCVSIVGKEFTKNGWVFLSISTIFHMLHRSKYIEIFAPTYADMICCMLGWAFPRDSPLAVDMSTAILKL